MPLPPLQPISNSHFCKSGDVTIHAGAVIAPGAILKADPGSQIIIASGVCIGMGAILHASEGTLEVETGATLGAGVLMVGKGKIGANACIGSATTIWNSSIATGQVVPSGSLLGDTGRQISETQGTAATHEELLNGQVSPPNSAAATSSGSEAQLEEPSTTPPLPTESTSSSGEAQPEEPSTAPPESATPSPESPSSLGVTVYGKANLNRLLTTLFPHNQSFKNANPDNQTD